MSSFTRTLQLLSVRAIAVSVTYRPGRWRQAGRRIRIVAYAYVAAILISAALHVFGVVDGS